MTVLEALKAARELDVSADPHCIVKCINALRASGEPNPRTVEETIALFDKAIARLEAEHGE